MGMGPAIKLPSGSELRIQIPAFHVSKNLYQALLREARGIAIPQQSDMGALYKDLFCVGLSSELIEACTWECLKTCLYNNLTIDAKTFEPEEARDDYIHVCMEVVKANVMPFMKSLYAEYCQALAKLPKSDPT